jgi:hypothetical protein
LTATAIEFGMDVKAYQKEYERLVNEILAADTPEQFESLRSLTAAIKYTGIKQNQPSIRAAIAPEHPQQKRKPKKVAPVADDADEKGAAAEGKVCKTCNQHRPADQYTLTRYCVQDKNGQEKEKFSVARECKTCRARKYADKKKASTEATEEEAVVEEEEAARSKKGKKRSSEVAASPAVEEPAQKRAKKSGSGRSEKK